MKFHAKYKMSMTKEHVFFLTGPLSQWHPSTFTVTKWGNVPHTFNCAEQYMMAAKAKLFEDHVAFDMIMKVQHTGGNFNAVPKRQKELGRKVRNFDEKKWNANARSIVLHANLAKFGQDEKLYEFLKMTSPLHLVEGASYDPVWGVGLAWSDPKIENPWNWQGTNWLGETLMEVRKILMIKKDAMSDGE